MEQQNGMTTYIARIVSVYYLVTGIGFIISRDFFAGMIAHTGSDPVLINLSGMVHFFIGMTIVVFHFKWKGVFQSVVTILGFLFLLKGVFLIAVPELTLQTGNNEVQISWVTPAIFIAIGTIVGYYSYVHRQIVNSRLDEEKQERVYN